MTYNTTELNVETEFKRSIFNRDRFAHFFRWTHILSLMRTRKHNVLDVGCGSGALLKVLFNNRCCPKVYIGIDYRKTVINKIEKEWGRKREKYDVGFHQCDIVKNNLCNFFKKIGRITEWDFIVCFEVIEHIGKRNINKALKNIATQMSTKTKLFISTPVYDERVGAADNHIIDGEVGEFKFNELKKHLEKYFVIENVNGTFASQKDVVPVLDRYETVVYKKMKQYYDSNLLSLMFAPFHPEQSRNCIWTLTKKQ